MCNVHTKGFCSPFQPKGWRTLWLRLNRLGQWPGLTFELDIVNWQNSHGRTEDWTNYSEVVMAETDKEARCEVGVLSTWFSADVTFDLESDLASLYQATARELQRVRRLPKNRVHKSWNWSSHKTPGVLPMFPGMPQLPERGKLGLWCGLHNVQNVPYQVFFEIVLPISKILRVTEDCERTRN